MNGLSFAPGESLPLTYVTIMDIRMIHRILSGMDGKVTIICDSARYGSPDDLSGAQDPVHTLHLVAQRPRSRKPAVEVSFDIPSLTVRINSDQDWQARWVAAKVLQYLERLASTHTIRGGNPVLGSVVLALSALAVASPMLLGIKPTIVGGAVTLVIIWLLAAQLPVWLMPPRGVYLSAHSPRGAIVSFLTSVAYKVVIPVLIGLMQTIGLALLRRL